MLISVSYTHLDLYKRHDYNIFKGIFDSPWIGFKVFEKVFANKNFWLAIKNTFVLNLTSLAVSFPLTIIVSLMLNELLAVTTISGF